MSRRLQFLKSALPYFLMLLMVVVLAWGQPAPPPQTPLASPTNLSAASGPNPGEVTLNWTPAAGAVLNWVWSMKLDGTDYRWHQAAAGAGSLIITGLDAGEPHQFLVIAIFAPGEGGSPARWTFSNFATGAPQVAPPPSAMPSPVAAGGGHTCLLQDDNTVLCWGANGNADKGQADPPAGKFVAITTGYEHTCGIAAGGAARC